jgi:hypothetical protein
MDHDDPLIAYADGFDDLVAVLGEVEHPGSFCFSAAVPARLPKLGVGDAGILGFPVSAEQCRRIVDTVATRAPYGRGGETILDESVRKVWQIAPARVELGGVGWEETFAGILRRAAQGLGCEEMAIEAEPHKLLVYETGGFFSAHRDSEKAGGMFGTLVIALPSAHEGGCLRVRHLGEEVTIDLCNEDPGQLMVAAFYADCEHEVLPITSGYRVCLVFNLIQKPSSGGTFAAPDHRAPIQQAATILKEWAEGRRGDAPKLVWLLRHRYTSAGLSFEGLKGQDAAVAGVLGAAAERSACAMHLAIVHVEESGWAEYGGGGYSRRRGRFREVDDHDDDDFSIGEVCDGRYFIDSWRNVRGDALGFGEIPLEDHEALPPGALDGEEADEKHFTEATGNEGASFDRTYLRAACVLWPRDRTDEICLGAGVDAGLGLLEERVTMVRQAVDTSPRAASPELHAFLEKLLARWETGHTPGLRLRRLLAALTMAGDPALARALPADFLAESFTGAQNAELLSWASLLDEDGARGALRALLGKNASREPAACLDLWTSIAGRNAAPALLEATLAALLEGVSRCSPEARRRVASWRAAEDLKPPSLEPALVARFLLALHRSTVAPLLDRAVLTFTADLRTFAPETILLPALEALAQRAPGFPPAAALTLWQATAAFFLERSEAPPVPPKDWTMPVKFAQNEPILRELAAFARSPLEQEHHFRARKELRQIVHQAIDSHQLDMTHVTDRRGSPYTLVCRKTLGSYQKACQRYRQDLAAIQRLVALPIAASEPGESLRRRLLIALDRFTAWSPVNEPG